MVGLADLDLVSCRLCGQGHGQGYQTSQGGEGLDCLASICPQREGLRSRILHWEAWQLHPEPTPTEARMNVSEGERQGGWVGGQGERERERKGEGERVYTAYARAPGCLCEYMCTVEIFIPLDVCPEKKHIW